MVVNTEVQEQIVCKRHPWYLMVQYGKVLEPPPGGGIIDFQPWPHLQELADLVEKERLVLIGKARQVGVSWLLALYSLWYVLFREGATILMLSKGQAEAAELLNKVRFAWHQLPPFLRREAGQDQAMMLTFPLTNSKIRVLPSTENAGVGETATLVICDEWDLHPYASANYASLKPTIDAGGQFIGASAFYKEDMGTFFKDMWRMAPGNGFKKLFLNWMTRPGRDADWYSATKRTYPDLDLFLGQYPATEEEALAPPQEKTFFDVHALLRMPALARNGAVYKPKATGHRYCAGLDPAGEGEDRHSLHILDARTGEVVVALAEPGPVELFAQKAYDLLVSYGKPILGLEENGAGLAMKKLLQALGYGNFYYSDKDRKRGWVTNTLTKPNMLIELGVAVREGAILIYDKETITEMLELTREMKAPGGRHDDRVMSLAIAWQMRRETPVGQPLPTIGGLKWL